MSAVRRRVLHTVLVANRGEIAVRVIRAAADAGLSSVAVYAEGDRDAPHVRLADAAYPLGGATAAETYLSAPKLLAVAAESGADSLHPGYGFLSENADFAQAVIDDGLVWIGPGPQAIRHLGDKVSARRIAGEAGAPLVPGSAGSVADADEVVAFAETSGLPVAIKASFGGGGRGLRVARTIEEIPDLFEAARREAVGAFGRDECFVERYLERPRHVEAQVLADQHGNVVVVGTRDCSLQRRHQKLVEEAPAPYLSAEQRMMIHESARAICRHAGYVGAGTVEFLVGGDGAVSFLEVNARLQVEHPVTEETAGVDLVREMFRIAAGEELGLEGDPEPRGHAIEYRINAEDPGRGFVPTPGTLTSVVWPSGPGVRVDAGVERGGVVEAQFDSMLAKLIVTGTDRTNALERSRRALDEITVEGVATVIPFHRAVVRDPAFTSEGDGFAVHTRWIEAEFDNVITPFAGGTRLGADEVTIEVGGRAMVARLPGLTSLGPAGDPIRAHAYQAALGGKEKTGDAVTAPMRGTIIKVLVANGQHVETGEVLVVLEAMKMENAVVAHKAGTVAGLSVTVGQGAKADAVLCELRPVPSAADDDHGG
ncbi:MAG: ATP-grasp domain-containing protein [Actinomycetota bacterium]|nr:ATP-grasp domain-containing protein [Actinomycetota bacterium]